MSGDDVKDLEQVEELNLERPGVRLGMRSGIGSDMQKLAVSSKIHCSSFPRWTLMRLTSVSLLILSGTATPSEARRLSCLLGIQQ